MVCGLLVAACMWDLVPRPGMETVPPALGVWSLTHWTTREVLVISCLLFLFCYKLYIFPQKNSLQTTTITKVNTKNCPCKEKEGEEASLIFVLKESFSFLPTRPITHWIREHLLQESHRLKATQDASPPLQLGTSGQCKTCTPTGLPWKQRGCQRCPMPCFPPFVFSSHSIKYYFGTSTLCLCFTFIDLHPSETLSHFTVTESKAQRSY